MSKSKRSKTCHDDSVKKRATALKANGWSVKADIPEFPRPLVLNGSRPDIDARKGTKRRIVEVETKNSKNKDKQQQKNLRDYAKGKKNTQFMTRTCGL